MKIAIVGLGKIGASLGLAWKAVPERPEYKGVELGFELVGFDPDPRRRRTAEALGAVDQVVEDPETAVRGARVVALALPLDDLEALFPALAGWVEPGAVLFDTAPLKAPVCAWAERYLPEGVTFVAGHPAVAEGETAEATADLFRGITFALHPLPTAREEGVRAVTNLVALLGAESYFVAPEEHDSLIAAVETFPVLWAAALVDTLLRAGGRRDLERLAAEGGPLLVGTEGVLGKPPEERAREWWRNREALRAWVQEGQATLAALERILAVEDPEEGEARLARWLSQVIEGRVDWIPRAERERRARRALMEEIEAAGAGLGQFFLGGWLRRRRKS